MAQSRRPYTPWEIRMVGEWVTATFPDVTWQTNVRLGSLEARDWHGRFTRSELEALGVWRRRVDAIVILPDRLLLVEAVLRAHPGKLATLQLYARLVPQTPELEQYRALRVQLVLVYVIEDPTLLLLARDYDVLAVQFVPSFFDAWFATLRARERRAPRSL